MVLIVGGEGSGKRSFAQTLGFAPEEMVGSGVIPIDYETRLGREAVGRLCVRLAQRAECVVRMVCGIPTVIKGELPCRSI